MACVAKGRGCLRQKGGAECLAVPFLFVLSHMLIFPMYLDRFFVFATCLLLLPVAGMLMDAARGRGAA